MTPDFSFPVYRNLDVRRVRKVFFSLSTACLVLLVLFSFHMLPSRHSSGEMKAAYFLLTTPETARKILVGALIGTPVFFLLYIYFGIRRRAVLTLHSNSIEITGARKGFSIPTQELTSIDFNDAKDSDGFPKAELTVSFTTKKGKSTTLTLIDYSQSEQFMNVLMRYQHINFTVTQFPYAPELL
jgi:hypothetical protein